MACHSPCNNCYTTVNCWIPPFQQPQRPVTVATCTDLATSITADAAARRYIYSAINNGPLTEPNAVLTITVTGAASAAQILFIRNQFIELGFTIVQSSPSIIAVRNLGVFTPGPGVSFIINMPAVPSSTTSSITGTITDCNPANNTAFASLGVEDDPVEAR